MSAPEPASLRELRLQRYETKTSTAMVILAFAYLILYAVEVLAPALPGPVTAVVLGLSDAIWVIFVVDLVIRVALAHRRLRYLLRHPLDVLAVAVPMFRFLRILRVITAGQWLVSRGKHLAVGRTAAAVAVAVSFLAVVGGLAILDAERDAPDALIRNFGDALWWAFTTMSTVGYGDVYPVTTGGRMVAVAMMIVGVSLLGIVSATLAAGFLAQTQVVPDPAEAALLNKVDHLERQVAELVRLLTPDPEASPGSTGGSL